MERHKLIKHPPVYLDNKVLYYIFTGFIICLATCFLTIVNIHDSKITYASDKKHQSKSEDETTDVSKIDAAIETKSLIKFKLAIKNTLIDTLQTISLPQKEIYKIIKAYSAQVNFKKQIKPTDIIELIVEKFVDNENNNITYGNVVFSSLNVSNKKYTLYRYKQTHDSYFLSPDGTNAGNFFLKTPVEHARISSKYGYRVHPIHKCRKLHKGIDYAAKEGTPILSAKSGVVTAMGWQRGYGNYIKIKHEGNIETFYAHIKSFDKNLKLGGYVKEGTKIAHVGRTGKATGPHLHFEVRVNGKHVNPLTIKNKPSHVLNQIQLASFKQFKEKIDKISAFLEKTSQYIENT